MIRARIRNLGTGLCVYVCTLRNKSSVPRRLLRNAVLSYLREGSRIGATEGELVDFFCVDTPNIVESAGYGEAAAHAVARLFFEVYDQLQREKKPDRLHNDSQHYQKCHYRWQKRGNRRLWG